MVSLLAECGWSDQGPAASVTLVLSYIHAFIALATLLQHPEFKILGVHFFVEGTYILSTLGLPLGVFTNKHINFG